MGDYIFLKIAESSSFNSNGKYFFLRCWRQFGRFCGKHSIDNGKRRIITFVAKTKLIKYYRETLGADIINGYKAVIFSDRALTLIKKYFNK